MAVDSGSSLAIVLWLASLIGLLAQAWRGRVPVVGLSLGYWCTLASIHLPGGMIQLLPWHWRPDQRDTLAGFRLTGLAMASLLLGNLLIDRRLFPFLPVLKQPIPVKAALRPLALNYIAIGLVFYFLACGLLRFIPSSQAVLSGGLPLAAGGFCLLWWYFRGNGAPQMAWLVVIAACLLPGLSVVLMGFLGFGALGMLPLGCFIAVFHRPRRTIVLIGLISLFLGLSVFCTYYRARNEIRRVVWSDETRMRERVGITYLSLLENLGWFDATDESDLGFIENRLNQNVFLGIAYRNLNSNKVEFGNGETLYAALLALIPRAIWLDKPVWAGTSAWLTHFTGIRIAEGTAWGMGHIMELYVNFGMAGLFVGFGCLGALLKIFDMKAGAHLRAGHARDFIAWSVSGQGLVMTGVGSFAESTAAVAGHALLCMIINRSLPRDFSPSGLDSSRSL